MSNWKLLCREIAHRKMNFLLSLLAMTAAAMLFIVSPTLMGGYQRESDQQLRAMQVKADTDLANLDKRTKRIMRDLGFNLRIVHKNTDLSRLYANFVSFDMPESYVTTLAESPEITKIVHLVATLRQMIELEGKPRLLVGFAPEATQSHIEQKAPMGFQIKQGTVFLGHLAGEGYKVGESIEVMGKSFEIANILAPRGTRDEDIFIAMHLKDAQQLLEKEGLISEIVALGCKCKTVNRVEEIMAQLEAVLPEAKVVELSTRAIAREEQRKLVTIYYEQQMSDYEAGREGIRTLLLGLDKYVVPLIVLVCAIWVGLLAWSNVRQRRTEIGLLRALGKKSTGILSLLLGKALIVGLLGGILGSLLGLAIASQLAQSELLAVSSENFKAPTLLLVATIGGAPLVAALASYLPTLIAVQQDPAVVLMDG
jgi:ABC-type lipoprotein release transport system permease subunit